MGCIQKKKTITFGKKNNKTLSTTREINQIEGNLKLEKEEFHYFQKINKGALIHIVDFLNYNELKEIGKIDKNFNAAIKLSGVLVKFFKNKKEQTLKTAIEVKLPRIESFSEFF